MLASQNGQRPALSSPVESFFGLKFKLAAARIELRFSNLVFKALHVPMVVFLFALSPLEPGPEPLLQTHTFHSFMP